MPKINYELELEELPELPPEFHICRQCGVQLVNPADAQRFCDECRHKRHRIKMRNKARRRFFYSPERAKRNKERERKKARKRTQRMLRRRLRGLPLVLDWDQTDGKGETNGS